MAPHAAQAGLPGPGRDCPRCPRLVELRRANRRAHADWHNAPVPSFAPASGPVELLIVGLAPGLKGANRTGRPFTGDFAGGLLYPALVKFGFAAGRYEARPDDGLRLVSCRITNAVRCVPPQNRPLASEIANCRGFLAAEIAALPRLRLILALGGIAHAAVLDALRLPRAAHPFRHGAFHALGPHGKPRSLVLADSYHCSRINVQTRRLTPAMLERVIAKAHRRLRAPAGKSRRPR